MARSVAIVGAGQIGFAAAFAFRDRGWDVCVYARSKPQWHDRLLFRFKPHTLGNDSAPAADVVLDTIAFDAEDIERYDPETVGRLIVISSASVYRDDEGRTLDEAAQNGFPDFSGPITEEQATVAPGPDTYSTRKVRMENKALELFGDRATILRPCAIYGPWSRHPREWWFVKRMLDERRRIPLIHGGRSQFQTTDVNDIAYFAVDVAEQGLSGIYNVADEGCPTVVEIGEVLGWGFDNPPELALVEASGLLGRTPWSVEKPFTVSNTKMIAAGYDLPSTYGSGVLMAGEWLRDFPPADWRASFPQLAAYPWDLFDYAAEDAYLEKL